MKVIFSYSVGKDVSTVVRDLPADTDRKGLAHSAMMAGVALEPGDVWCGQQVTEQQDKVFFRPCHVAFVEV